MLTFDRFLSLYLNVRYTLWLNEKKTKVILGICFGFGVLADILFFCFLENNFEQTLTVMSVYLWVPFDDVFILVAIVTYIYIFVSIKRKQRENITGILASYNRETENININVGMEIIHCSPAADINFSCFHWNTRQRLFLFFYTE